MDSSTCFMVGRVLKSFLLAGVIADYGEKLLGKSEN